MIHNLGIFNTILDMKDSLQSIQTRLFVKRCLMDELMVENGTFTEPGWANSFIYDQTIGYSIGRIYRLKKLFTKN
jgi:hypothetical protein